MKLAIVALVVAILATTTSYSRSAEPPPAPPTPEQTRQECDRQGEEAGNKAVTEAKLQHPGDVVQIKKREKQNKFNQCMRAAGYATGPIRTK